jgi:murein DD-endopeptidase MepM/ murein hydrolase activator NlpD
LAKSYFILVVAHSIKGRIRRIQIPYYALHVVAALAIVGAITVIGAVGSYGRMLLKVGHYNHLRKEVAALQERYSDLQGSLTTQQQQLASLQSLANEVSLAYGLKRVTDTQYLDQGSAGSAEFRNSVEQYRLLIRASLSTPMQRRNLFEDRWRVIIPSLWPVEGVLTGSFGDRLDPFNGEGAFHSGLDISTGYGTPVRATGDGVVVTAERSSGYGLIVEVDHGRGITTRYAHLSGFTVVAGQAVTGGEIVGFVGRTGRSTGAHVHYEVRVNGGPVNPSKFMRGSEPHAVKAFGSD